MKDQHIAYIMEQVLFYIIIVALGVTFLGLIGFYLYIKFMRKWLFYKKNKELKKKKRDMIDDDDANNQD